MLNRLAQEWYLTSSGEHVRLGGGEKGGKKIAGSSEYDYFIMKPTRVFTEMFNIKKEIIAVFSDYPTFESRTLDTFDIAQKSIQELRIESVCRVLISKDPNIEEKVTELLKTDPEQPIVIPFTYEELTTSLDDPFFLRNRFRDHFYTRNLFGFLSPLRKDIYFFGRSELLNEIVNRHRSGEHTGLFGLRKSGKTSIIYAIERHLEAHVGAFVSFDCESPAIHRLRWHELLEKIVCEYKKRIESKYSLKTAGRYDDKKATDSFEEDMLGIHASKKAQPLLILFDEIERISPITGSSDHWRTGEDFIFFWQTLRAFFQRNQRKLTYMLVGTNPNCVELPRIAGHENPLYNSIPSRYVPSFTVRQTREMVRKLGKYMGIRFDEMIYGKLCEDFGGHPFLIRQYCSLIHEKCPGDRPLEVDKPLYEKVMKSFTATSYQYLDMIVSVLKECYPDEYDMLRFLAQGDKAAFEDWASDNIRYTKHLLGYGLITQGKQGGYSFNIEALKHYIGQKHKFESINLTQEEKLAEISSRRNGLEKSLRVVMRNNLRTSYGSKKAGTQVLKSIPQTRRDKIGSDDLNILLSKDTSPLFFLEIISIIQREWDIFKNMFELEKNKVEVMLNEINEAGRSDAHAKEIQENDFQQLRLHFSKLEEILDSWLS